MAGKDISYSDLKSLIQDSKDLLLVDVRSKDEVDKGRIPGSIHIPVLRGHLKFGLLADSEAFCVKDTGWNKAALNRSGRSGENAPVDEVEMEFSLDTQDFQEKFGVPKPLLDSHDLVFHCHMGRRGAAATEKAKSLGFKNARNYAGGYKEWSEKEDK